MTPSTTISKDIQETGQRPCPKCGGKEPACELCGGAGLVSEKVQAEYWHQVEAENPESFCSPENDYENLPSYQRGMFYDRR